MIAKNDPPKKERFLQRKGHAPKRFPTREKLQQHNKESDCTTKKESNSAQQGDGEKRNESPNPLPLARAVV